MKRIVVLDDNSVWRIDSVWDTDVTPAAANTATGSYVRVADSPRASYYMRREIAEERGLLDPPAGMPVAVEGTEP